MEGASAAAVDASSVEGIPCPSVDMTLFLSRRGEGQGKLFAFSRRLPIPPTVSRRLRRSHGGESALQLFSSSPINQEAGDIQALGSVSGGSQDGDGAATVAPLVGETDPSGLVGPELSDGNVPSSIIQKLDRHMSRGSSRRISLRNGQASLSPIRRASMAMEGDAGGAPSCIGGSPEELQLDKEEKLEQQLEKDRLTWTARAMRKHPEVLELHERLRPISRHPSYSFLPQLLSSPLDLEGKDHSSSTLHPSSSSPSGSGLSPESPDGESTGGGASSSQPTGRRQRSASLSKRMGFGLSTDDSGFHSRVPHPAPRGLTECKHVLNQKAVLQLIHEHLILCRWHNTRKCLEEESKMNFVMQSGETSSLKTLLQMGIPDKDYLFKVHSLTPTDGFVNTGQLVTTIGAVDNLCTVNSSESKNSTSEEDNLLMDADVARDEQLYLWEEIMLPTGVSYGADGSLKAASLNKLVEKLTDRNADMEFIKVFLVTYRSFTTPERLLQKLLERFDVPEFAREEDMTEESFALFRTQVQLRVGNVLKMWIEGYFADFSHGMVKTLSDFMDSTLSQGEHAKSTGKILRVALEKQQAGRSTAFGDVMFSGFPPQPVIPANIFTLELTLWDVDEVEIARQMTLSDSAFLRKIQPSEFLNQAWNKAELRHRSPHILGSIDRFNRISNWICRSLLGVERLRDRRAMLHRIIRLLGEFRKLKNFNSLLSVLSGLQNSSTHEKRLKHTWAEMPKPLAKIFDDCCTLMNPAGSFSAYRTELRTVQIPCVPHLGVYLSDLVFTEDGNPDFVKVGDRTLINWSKRNMVCKPIRLVQNFQDGRYNLVFIHQIADVLDREVFRRDRVPEETLFEMSQRLEPRNARKEDIL